MNRRILLMVIVILMFSSQVRSEIITSDGTLKSIDAKKRVISVEIDGKTKEFDVSSKVKINLDGKEVKLDSLKEGHAVSLSYHDDLDVVLKIDAGEVKTDDATAKTMKTIQGEWKCIAGEENGNTQDKKLVKHQNRRLTIKGHSLKMTRVVGEKSGIYVGKFEIDAGNGHFDWIGKGPGGNSVEWIGIYEIKNDKLKLCYIYQKDEKAKRPTTFKTSTPIENGMAHVFYIYERDKD